MTGTKIVPEPPRDGSRLYPEQVEALLRDLRGSRVMTDDGGHSHLAAWDVRAALTRVFGFGGWDEIAHAPTVMLFDVPRVLSNGKDGFHVAYRADRRLVIRTPDGHPLCTHDGSAVGESVMPVYKHGDAHDMAMKTAESQALKRCAINLGTMFGLSLYNRGALLDVVKVTLVGAPNFDGDDPPSPDVQPEIERPPLPDNDADVDGMTYTDSGYA